MQDPLQRCCALFVAGLDMLRGSYPESFVQGQEPDLFSGLLGAHSQQWFMF